MRRVVRVLAATGALVLLGCAGFAPATWAADPAPQPLAGLTASESEPNDTIGAATAVTGTARVRGNIAPAGDQDLYSFTAAAGDRVYAATMTAGSSRDTLSALALIASDGSTVIESDTSDGSFAAGASSIAGASIPTAGTYYLRVEGVTGSTLIRPYDLYLRLRSGSPTGEAEPNDAGSPQALGSGWAAGAIGTAGDQDFYSFTASAGDTVYLSLDMDPERDGTTWNGRLGLGVFGSPGGFLVANDPNTTSPSSEALFTTVKDAGTYFVEVDDPSALEGGASSTYRLSVTVVPAATRSCRTYSGGSSAIPDTGTATSAIAVPDDVTLDRVALAVDLDHASMPDVDMYLQTPAGNAIGLATDIGSSTQTHMGLRFDDDAALPPSSAIVAGQVVEPSAGAGRLHWTDGESSAGTWTLVIEDDNAGNTGTLNAWTLTACGAPPPAPAPTVYASDFEADDGGFTHSGTGDEWERGTPSFAPITSCARGSSCWKTDLNGTYNASSTQNLVSPPIAVPPAVRIGGPTLLTWDQRYQMENATFDHFWVDVHALSDPNRRRVFEWTGPTMTQSVGTPDATIAESAGWGRFTADISGFAGQTVEITFHLDSDVSVSFAGAAIDNVRVAGGTDFDAPETTIDSGPSGTTDDSTPTFAFSSDEPRSTFQCQVDGGSFGACASPHTTAPLADGQHTFQVRAVDEVGNVDATPASRAFTVDTSGPAAGGGGGGGQTGGSGEPGGGAGGLLGGSTVATLPDTTPPGFGLPGTKKQKAGKTVAVVVEAGAEDLVAGATGGVSVPGAAKLYALKGVSNVAIARGTRRTLKLKVPKKAQKAIKRILRRRRSVRANIVVTARDAAGNPASTRVAIALTR